MRDDETITRHVELEFEPTPSGASNARRQARVRLDEAALPTGLAADLELVISELATNAVEQGPSAPVRLDLIITEAEVVVTMTNETTGSAPELQHVVDHAADHGDRADPALPDRGWGLGIIQALTDEMWFDGDAGWTSVSCRRRR